jgi:hypothetical protein
MPLPGLILYLGESVKISYIAVFVLNYEANPLKCVCLLKTSNTTNSSLGFLSMLRMSKGDWLAAITEFAECMPFIVIDSKTFSDYCMDEMNLILNQQVAYKTICIGTWAAHAVAIAHYGGLVVDHPVQAAAAIRTVLQSGHLPTPDEPLRKRFPTSSS